MLAGEHLAAAQRREQPRVQSFPQGGLLHIDIRIGREGAGFRAAVGVDVEEPAPRRSSVFS